MRTQDDIEKDIFAAKRLGKPTNKLFRELNRARSLAFVSTIILMIFWILLMFLFLWPLR